MKYRIPLIPHEPTRDQDITITVGAASPNHARRTLLALPSVAATNPAFSRHGVKFWPQGVIPQDPNMLIRLPALPEAPVEETPVVVVAEPSVLAFALVTDEGKVWTSEDGETWLGPHDTTIVSGFPHGMAKAASRLLIYGWEAGTLTISASTDKGLTWTEYTSTTYANHQSGRDGSNYMAANDDGSIVVLLGVYQTAPSVLHKIYTSTSGGTDGSFSDVSPAALTPTPATAPGLAFGVRFIDDVFYIQHELTGLWSSPDGTTWTSGSTVSNFLPRANIAGGPGHYCVVGAEPLVSLPWVFVTATSNDGVTWTRNTPTLSEGFRGNHSVSLAYGADVFVTSAWNGTNTVDHVYRSVDFGVTWTMVLTLGAGEFTWMIEYVNDRFLVAISDFSSSWLIWSTDGGVTWSSRLEISAGGWAPTAASVA